MSKKSISFSTIRYNISIYRKRYIDISIYRVITNCDCGDNLDILHLEQKLSLESYITQDTDSAIYSNLHSKHVDIGWRRRRRYSKSSHWAAFAVLTFFGRITLETMGLMMSVRCGFCLVEWLYGYRFCLRQTLRALLGSVLFIVAAAHIKAITRNRLTDRESSTIFVITQLITRKVPDSDNEYNRLIIVKCNFVRILAANVVLVCP